MSEKEITGKNVVETDKEKNKSESDTKVLYTIFPLIVSGMKILGLWPTSPTPWRRRIFVFLNIFYVHGPMVVYVVKHRHDFLQASYGFCEMVAGSIYYFRLLWFGILPHLYLDVINTLVITWKDAKKSGLSEWTANRKIIERNTYRFSAGLITYFVLAGLKYSVVTIGLQVFRVYVLKKDERIDFGYHIDYIVNVLDPFDPIGYSILVIPMLTVFMTFIFALSFTGVFLALIIYFTGILFRIVCININDLDQKMGSMSEKEILKELKLIVIAHQKAISTANNLERALRYSMLFQVMINSFLICLIGFDIFAIHSDSTTISNLTGYGIAILSEFFLDSYVCDSLTREVAQVPSAVWNAKWYSQSPKVRRHFLFIMAYGQKTIGISAGKYYLISLNSFLSVVRAGISYFTLMRQVYSK